MSTDPYVAEALDWIANNIYNPNGNNNNLSPQAERIIRRRLKNREYRERRKIRMYTNYQQDPCSQCPITRSAQALAYKRHRG